MNHIEKYKIPIDLCDKFIEYHKTNTEYKNKQNIVEQKRISTDVCFFNFSQTKFIQDFFNLLSTCVRDYIKKYGIREALKTYISNHIQYYKPGEGFAGLHYERGEGHSSNRELVYMLYCNTLKNGGTRFPNQKKILNATKGALYIWPAAFTHFHQGVISNKEEKYIVTGWFEYLN